MKTLILTNPDEALELLPQELVCLFDDNGGASDGPAYLPSAPIDKREAATVLAARAGRMVDAHYLTDREVASRYRIEDALELVLRDGDADAFKNAADDAIRSNGETWAHYAAYGAGDSLWVIAKL